MKKFLLSLLVFSCLNVLAQPPFPAPCPPQGRPAHVQCPVSIKSNQGAGDCDPKTITIGGVTYTATAKITLEFANPLPPGCVPRILEVEDNQGNLWYPKLGVGEIQKSPNNNRIEYCLYSTEPNDNLFNQPDLIVTLEYPLDCNVPLSDDPLQVVPSCIIRCHSSGTEVRDEGALPVTFASFIINRNNDKANIQWQTAMESSNRGFYIERKTGNGDWTRAGFVPSQAQDGNSNSLLTYSFNEINISKGITQYRIRQVDIDGRNKLSEIRTLRGLAQMAKTLVFPNPSMDGKVSVVFEEAKTIRDLILIDMNGKVLQQWRGVSNNNHQIENLQSGVYTLRIIDRENGNQVNEKIIVNRR